MAAARRAGSWSTAWPRVVNQQARVVGPAAQGFHPTDHMEDMKLLQAVWIGAVADPVGGVPGHLPLDVHDCGGADRRDVAAAALEFSFFLSIPTMVVATVYDSSRRSS